MRLWSFGTIVSSVLFPQILGGYLRKVGAFKLFLGFLLAAAIFFFLKAILVRSLAAGAIELGMIAGLAILNQYVVCFRGSGLTLMDLMSWRTALNVAGKYDLGLSRRAVLMLLLLLCWLILGCFLTYGEEKKRREKGCGKNCEKRQGDESYLGKLSHIRSGLARRAGYLLITLCCLAALRLGTKEVEPRFWGNQGLARNGYLLNLCLQAKTLALPKPQGYSPKRMQELSEAYQSLPGQEGKHPILLVIMDESFTDMSQWGRGCGFISEVLPFFQDFRDRCIHGYSLSSVYGGMTPNTEYEFLTGATCAFLPKGSIPYLQYVRPPAESLVSLLKGQGYTCIAMHPYQASGWNRPAVYEAFGFDEMHFVDDYPGKDLIRGYISDRECFDQALSIVKDYAEKDQPLFLFVVTIQNHGEYKATEDLKGKISLNAKTEEGESLCPEAELYLNLIHETDAALKELVGQLDKLEAPVNLLFFGDHAPNLPDLLNPANPTDPANPTNPENPSDPAASSVSPEASPKEADGGMDLSDYQIPFLFWSNQWSNQRSAPAQQPVSGSTHQSDSEPAHQSGSGIRPDQSEKKDKESYTSMNFLGNLLLRESGLKLDPYQAFLSDLQEVIPAMNALGYYDRDRGTFLPLSEAAGREEEWLEDYAIWQYDRMQE